MCASSSLHQAEVDVNADYCGAFCMFLILASEGSPWIDSEFANKTVTAVNVVRPARSFGTSFLSPSVKLMHPKWMRLPNSGEGSVF